MNRPSSYQILLYCLAVVALFFQMQLPTVGFGAKDQKKNAAKKYERAVVIHMKGPITYSQEQFIFRSLKKAEQRKADLVILEIDSPGGTVDSSKNIAFKLLKTGWARTVAYVPQQAISGAAIVSLGCDEIVMQPNSQLGDSGVIYFDRNSYAFRYAPEKDRSHVVAILRELATETGRPPALAEAMADMNLVVYRVENTETGQTAYKSKSEIDSDENPKQWEIIAPVHETRAEHFLQVSGSRAVELQLANANVDSREALLKRYGIESPPMEYRWGAVDTTITILNNPFVTGLLFIIGLLALYSEFSAPGIGVGGLISLLCFALFFWSHFLGGTANWLEVVLFVTGLVFLLVEVFVIPGFGVFGITGLLLMLLGVVFASQDFIIPRSEGNWQTLLTSLMVVLGSGVVFIAGAMTMSRYFGSLPLVNQLALKPPSDNHVEDDDKGKPIRKNEDSLAERYGVGVGDWGVADSPLRPAGVARFEDNYLDVVADGSFIDRGAQVRIIEISGNRIVVRLVEDKPSSASG